MSSFSWPPLGLADIAVAHEMEPNSTHAQAQKISLPCDISGSFFPAADVDTFEFEAKKGEVWWVEVASERLGRPTDPTAVVQQVILDGTEEKLVDVAEFSDIASPVKVSTNGYAYDGPPYNGGSLDFIGKLEIKADGVYRMQLSDLFGGTRNDSNNIYRLIIRKAAPDFAFGILGATYGASQRAIAMRFLNHLRFGMVLRFPWKLWSCVATVSMAKLNWRWKGCPMV